MTTPMAYEDAQSVALFVFWMLVMISLICWREARREARERH